MTHYDSLSERGRWRGVGRAISLIWLLLLSGCLSYEGILPDARYREQLDWGRQPLNLATCIYTDDDGGNVGPWLEDWNLGEGQGYGIFFVPVSRTTESRRLWDATYLQIGMRMDSFVPEHQECEKHIWFVNRNAVDQLYALGSMGFGLPEVLGQVDDSGNEMWFYDDWSLDLNQALRGGPEQVFFHELRHMLGCVDYFAVGPLMYGGLTMDDCYDRIREYKRAELEGRDADLAHQPGTPKLSPSGTNPDTNSPTLDHGNSPGVDPIAASAAI